MPGSSGSLGSVALSSSKRGPARSHLRPWRLKTGDPLGLSPGWSPARPIAQSTMSAWFTGRRRRLRGSGLPVRPPQQGKGLSF